MAKGASLTTEDKPQAAVPVNAKSSKEVAMTAKLRPTLWQRSLAPSASPLVEKSEA